MSEVAHDKNYYLRFRKTLLVHVPLHSSDRLKFWHPLEAEFASLEGREHELNLPKDV